MERTEITRTLPEIKASIRQNCSFAAQSILQVGRDLEEAKALVGHGGWLSFLNEMGFSASRAENWMKISREIQPGSALGALPYSKALALLALPAAEREEFARENAVEDKSAAEIKRLIAERNKAAEAANAETNRANALQEELNKIKSAPPQVIREEIEILPADYDAIKKKAQMADKNVGDAMQAAIEAEKRAQSLEAELARTREEQGESGKKRGSEALIEAVNAFLSQAEILAMHPEEFTQGGNDCLFFVKSVRSWCDRMEAALQSGAMAAEVVIK